MSEVICFIVGLNVGIVLAAWLLAALRGVPSDPLDECQEWRGWEIETRERTDGE
jgi:hypothetical protein